MQQTHYDGKAEKYGNHNQVVLNALQFFRNAAGFNLKKVFLIGKNENKKKFKMLDQFKFFGNHGTADQMEFQMFDSLKLAKEFFVQNNIYVCGIEITDSSESIIKQPFKGNTVFFLGNEGSGLLEQHKAICDHFVYIPQYTNKTASLNVGVASGIIFHHFAVWAGYEEQKIQGEKFQDQEQLFEEQKQKKQQLIEAFKQQKVLKIQCEKQNQEDKLDPSQDILQNTE